MADRAYDELLRQNERLVAIINRQWGASVAWVANETFEFEGFDKKRGVKFTIRRVLPVIKSKMVGGLVKGLTPPPWFAPLKAAA